jgi:hypothetical protein
MISPTDYKSLSDNLSLGQDQEQLIVDDFDDILNNMTFLLDYVESSSQYNGSEFYNSAIGSLDKEISNNKNNIQEEKIDSPSLMLSVVLALQKHVANNYGDVNDFLSDYSIKVKQTFADLSEATGYIIDPGNVE